MKRNGVFLYKWNGCGSMAGVEHSKGDTVVIAASRTSQSAKKICKQAANRLRELAVKFEELAEAECPFNYQTQKEINNR